VHVAHLNMQPCTLLEAVQKFKSPALPPDP